MAVPLEWSRQNFSRSVDRAHELLLPAVSGTGVYVIWYVQTHPERKPVCVYVGQGNISERLDEHRQDARILNAIGGHVAQESFATINDPSLRDAAERYLANVLKPVVGCNHPNEVPAAVTLPY